MKVVNALFYISLVIASTILFFGFSQSQITIGLVFVTFVGVFWALRHWKSWILLKNSSLFMFLLVVLFGVWNQVNGIWLLGGVIFSIISWDIERFLAKIQKVDRVLNEDLFVTKYLWRIGIVEILCLILGGVSLGINLEISFGWTLLLGILLVFSMSKVVGFLRKPGH